MYLRNAKLAATFVINEYVNGNTAVFCRNFAGNFKRQNLQCVRQSVAVCTE